MFNKVWTSLSELPPKTPQGHCLLVSLKEINEWMKKITLQRYYATYAQLSTFNSTNGRIFAHSPELLDVAHSFGELMTLEALQYGLHSCL